MPEGWEDRPKLSDPEVSLFNDFLDFARFCGGDPRPADVLAWFEIKGVPAGERSWMGSLYSSMAGALRKAQREAADG
jgi:hypothetical protein